MSGCPSTSMVATSGRRSRSCSNSRPCLAMNPSGLEMPEDRQDYWTIHRLDGLGHLDIDVLTRWTGAAARWRRAARRGLVGKTTMATPHGPRSTRPCRKAVHLASSSVRMRCTPGSPGVCRFEPGGDDDGHVHDSATLFDHLGQDVHPEVGGGADVDRPVAKGCHRLIQRFG